MDSSGRHATSGSVSLTRRAAHDGLVWLQHCTTPIRPDGSFEFASVVSDPLSLRAHTLWPTVGRLEIPQGVETMIVTVTLATPPRRARNFADLGARPPALTSARGIAGCYWLGHPWGPSREIELRSDHRVDWRAGGSDPLPRWEVRGRDSVRVYSFESAVWGWAGFTMDLRSPVDWSAIPALFESKTDGLERPDEWESFVTRVPCAMEP